MPHNLWMKFSAQTKVFLQAVQSHLKRNTPFHQVSLCSLKQTEHDSEVSVLAHVSETEERWWV